ncbi:hypothetical protein [uncultured Veillonella sp.]|uniref:hypothetical protein n=1 Tax=uncultured Veillonella sp. TaxID=159268 RepID=UPI002803F13E|nr:hypothetical protein [uncultured Veillonella sp.]
MEITIENCSSPGAQFSENTNNVLKLIYHWILDNDFPELEFIEFRRKLAGIGINDNNARNIYPLMKNSGFIEYSSRGILDTSKFFTSKGKAYILILETLLLIESENQNDKSESAILLLRKILEELIYDGVEQIINNAKYKEGLRWFLMFLLEYEKINKNEFAYMVYQMKHTPGEWIVVSKPIIEQYREGLIDINVKVEVHNDNKIKEKTGYETRLEGIEFFTAYNYYYPLVIHSGIAYKDGAYCCLKDREKLELLLGGSNG